MGGPEVESDPEREVRVGRGGGSRSGHLQQPAGQQEDRGANVKHGNTRTSWLRSSPSSHKTRGKRHNSNNHHHHPQIMTLTPQPTGLLRSFSLRKKGPEDFLHTSSMPCLAAPPPTSSSRERNSNFSVGRVATSGGAQVAATTPASAGLVLNSLAYQVRTKCSKVKQELQSH